MIGTMPTSAEPREQLRFRLEHLLAEIGQLGAEAEANPSELTELALERAKQEANDITSLLAALDHHRTDDEDAGVVRLNDRVTVRAPRARTREVMVVHEPALQIRARGFISVDSPLGAAVIGRRVGDTVTVRAPGGSTRFVIESVTRA